MKIDISKLFAAWKQFQVDHPTIAHGFVVVEGAVLGALVDYGDTIVNGTPFNFHTMEVLIFATAGVALRNYIKDNIKNLKAQITGTSETK